MMTMVSTGSDICPYLKGSREGAICMVINGFIREAASADIHRCFGCYTGCHLYRQDCGDYGD